MSGCEVARKRQDAPINRRLAIDEARIKLKRLGPTLEGSHASGASSPTRRRRKRPVRRTSQRRRPWRSIQSKSAQNEVRQLLELSCERKGAWATRAGMCYLELCQPIHMHSTMPILAEANCPADGRCRGLAIGRCLESRPGASFAVIQPVG